MNFSIYLKNYHIVFCVGPKQRELEQFEIKKQLDAGVIEHSNSERARRCFSHRRRMDACGSALTTDD